MATGTPTYCVALPTSRRSQLPVWEHYQITLGDVLAAHESALRLGGAQGVLDIGRLEAAIGRPYSGYHLTLHSKAAALLQSLIRNHGFVDGNKRTALLCVLLLVDRSGWQFSSERKVKDHFERLVVRVANDNLPFEEIEAWFERRIRRSASSQRILRSAMVRSRGARLRRA